MDKEQNRVYKKDLIERITNRLVERGALKTTYARKHTFYISDKDGNTAEFVVHIPAGKLQFVRDDVENMLEAFQDVVEDALRNGESVYMRNFMCLHPHYRRPRTTIHPKTKKRVPVPGVWVPKLDAYDRLRTAVKFYQLSLENPSNFDDIDISEFDDMDDVVLEEEGGADGS